MGESVYILLFESGWMGAKPESIGMGGPLFHRLRPPRGSPAAYTEGHKRTPGGTALSAAHRETTRSSV